ncbi:glycosyltransferase family 4 protein [Geofilum rubicundum]|uniref:Glycosyltransferase, group 1 n=1 Tax=Geofilum rubicundum JCM 15548 TaxID=1236989 RepID=A0A0E9M1R9_9BACT|nr:glycosyltransferase family 4 protein [Geofilum rubicundum]GAO31722.1 glycosyltransferase, group 1 [Geofilum rubicundum JCM 15548]
MQSTAKKKILVFIDWYLPGYKAGGPVRSMANMTGHLSGEFDFYIVTRNNEYGETAPYTDTIADSWNDLMPGVKVWYCSEGKASLTVWKHLIKTTSSDVVYINGVYSPKFSLLPLIAARLRRFKHVIVAPRGMLAGSAINVKKGKKQLFLKAAQWLRLYKNVQWHVTNQAEAEQVRQQIDPQAQTTIANNLPRKVTTPFTPVVKAEGTVRLCLPARVAPEKNTLYAIQCLKDLPGSIQVELDLYGQIYNQAYWQECLAEIELLPANITVKHKGFIQPEEIPATIKEYHALFLPTRGENFGHVILESFMAGRPVLISDQTPWRSLKEKKAGWDLPLEEIQQFSAVINELATMNQSTFDQWCQGAWQMGQESANDVALLDQYRKLFGVKLVF